METPEGKNRMNIVGLYEFLGTALFVSAILMTNNSMSIAFSLFASILIFGQVTGGHFNPAVSLGVYLQEQKFSENLIPLVMITFCQIGGGLFAQLIARAVLHTEDFSTIPADRIAKLCPQDPTNADWPNTSLCDNQNLEGEYTQDFEVFLNEVLCTFVFVSVILMVKGKNTAPTSDGVVGALTVALTLLGLIMAGGKLGACYNPAVGVSLPIWAQMTLPGGADYIMRYMWAYIVGPFVGAAVAGGFHNLHKAFYKPAVKHE